MADANEITTNPQNELEYLIDGGKRDLVSVGTLYQVLLRSQIYVLCNKPWDGKTADPEMKSLLMQPNDGTPNLLPIFTSPLRAGLAIEKYGKEYPHLNKVAAGFALAHAGGSTGLVINPGGLFDMVLNGQGIDQLKSVFGPKLPPVN